MEISQAFRDDFTCSLSKNVLKRRYLGSGLLTIFTVFNFGNTLAMTIMFLSKFLKFVVDSTNGTKNWEKDFGFPDNCIWIRSCRFSQPSRGYLPSDVNVLADNP